MTREPDGCCGCDVGARGPRDGLSGEHGEQCRHWLWNERGHLEYYFGVVVFVKVSLYFFFSNETHSKKKVKEPLQKC